MTTVAAALTGKRLAVADVEGNGGQPPEIIEIAVLVVDGAVSRDALHTWLVRPRERITPLVTRKVHGISNADVADAPTWAQRGSRTRAGRSARQRNRHPPATLS